MLQARPPDRLQARILRCLAVSVGTILFRRDRNDSLDLGSSGLRREQGIKAYREQHDVSILTTASGQN